MSFFRPYSLISYDLLVLGALVPEIDTMSSSSSSTLSSAVYVSFTGGLNGDTFEIDLKKKNSVNKNIFWI